MNVNLRSEKLSRGLLKASFLYLFALSCGFFLSLNSALTDYSSWETAWLHQRLHNFMNGLYYQTSLFRLASPYAYAHDFANHLTATHYLLALPYKLSPGLNSFYGLALFYNLASLFFFAFLLTRGEEEKAASPRRKILQKNAAALLVLFMACWGLFFTTIVSLLHPVLFTSPFFLASYWFSRKRKYDAWFFLCVMAVSFAQDDCALWMFTYCFALFVFEKKRRPAVIGAGLLGLMVFLTYSLFVQSDARWYTNNLQFSVDLVTTFGNQITEKLRVSLVFFVIGILKNIRWMIFMLSPAVFVLAILRPYSKLEKRHLALLMVAPAPYWFTIIIGRAGWHHYLPLVWCVFLVLADILPKALEGLSKNGPVRFSLHSSREVLTLVLAVVVFLAGSQKTVFAYPPLLLRVFGPGADVSGDRARMESNKNMIKEIRLIPSDRSLCFWTNHSIAAFVSDRPHIWWFPYAFDRTDYLVIQKGATDSHFEFTYRLDERELAELAEDDGQSRVYQLNKHCVTPEPCRVRPADAEDLKNRLVVLRGTHTVYLEDEDVLILKSKVQGRIPVPRFTRTLYWR